MYYVKKQAVSLRDRKTDPVHNQHQRQQVPVLFYDYWKLWACDLLKSANKTYSHRRHVALISIFDHTWTDVELTDKVLFSLLLGEKKYLIWKKWISQLKTIDSDILVRTERQLKVFL